MWTINVPISVPVTKKKHFPLNLNAYRNAHHHTLSKAKTTFHDLVAPKLSHIPILGQVGLTFTLFNGSRHRTDTSNVCAIVDKFFSDVLVTSGKIEDDNYNVVLSVDYRYGGMDKSDPRVEVTIEPVGTFQPIPSRATQEKPMQITIVQTDIEAAIRNWISNQINVRDDMRIDIDLRATRGAEGFQAIIDIVPEDTPEKPPRREADDSDKSDKSDKADKGTKADKPQSTPTRTTKPKASDAPETKQEEVGNVQSDAEADQENPAAQETSPANEDASESEPQKTEDPEPTPVRSIFSNLKKPVNG